MIKLLTSLLIVISFAACTSKFYVGPRTADCAIGGRSECFLIKYSPDDNWMLIPEDILGFIYEEGYVYKIKVKKTKVKDDFGNMRDGYILMEVISKDEYVSKKKQAEVGENKNTSYRLIDFIIQKNRVELPNKDITLNMDEKEGKISGNAGCNNYFGDFTLTNEEKIELKPIGSTKMLCSEGSLSDFENKFLATLQASSKIIRQDNSLVLTTKNGGSLVFQAI